MKKTASLFLRISLLALLALFTGCTSPGPDRDGSNGLFGDDLGEFGMGLDGSIPMGDRFTGGTEHPGMFASVLFAYDSSQVSGSEHAKIEQVADYLQQNADSAVIVEGHCDEKGSREYNMALGERRALSVRTYLTGLGISSDRIQTKSLGEEIPAVPGHDAASHSQNRRGEFVLYY